MLKNKYFWPSIIVISIGISTLIQSGLDSFNIWSVLGRATGIIIFPGIAALITVGLAKLVQKELGKSKLNQAFLIWWICGLFLFLLPFWESVQ